MYGVSIIPLCMYNKEFPEKYLRSYQMLRWCFYAEAPNGGVIKKRCS